MALTDKIDFAAGDDKGTAYTTNLTIAGGAKNTTPGVRIPCEGIRELALLPQATCPPGASGTLTFDLAIRAKGGVSDDRRITLDIGDGVTRKGPIYLLDVNGFDSIQFFSVVNGDGSHQLTAVNVNIHRVGRLMK